MSLPSTVMTTPRMGTPMEARKATRYRLSAPAFYWWEGSDGILREAQGTTCDISFQGVFILAKELPPPGARVELDVHLPALTGTARSAQLHGEGTVLRTSAPEVRESGFAAAVVFHAESSDTASLLDPGRIQ